jgi:hypothetical protein
VLSRNNGIPKPSLPVYNLSQRRPSTNYAPKNILFASISRDRGLLGLGQTDGGVAEVIYRVPLPQESIAENGKRAYGLREVHTHEGGDARALNLQNVVVGTDGEVVAGKRKGEVGQTVALVALNRVLAVVALLGTNLLVPMYC